MRLFRKASAEPPTPPAPPSFGEWLVRKFTAETPSSDLPFARLEQACSNASSLLCGAAFANPDQFRPLVSFNADLVAEAALVAKRTANGFQASLQDRDHAVLSWPWDHLATRVTWRATQSGDLSEKRLGDELLLIATAYSLAHREQLEAVVGLWEQVVAGIKPAQQASLPAMGAEMFSAYELESGTGTLG